MLGLEADRVGQPTKVRGSIQAAGLLKMLNGRARGYVDYVRLFYGDESLSSAQAAIVHIIGDFFAYLRQLKEFFFSE